jgi:CheY-like chemotaxis protein
MPPQALLLCRDPDSLRVMRRVLDDVGVSVEACTIPDPAIEMLARRKFDAVIIDCDDLHKATDVLRSVRLAPSNKTAIVFAIINGITSVQAAFQMGANFVLDKPLTVERALRSMRAAVGLMMRERRRYFRQTVDIAVHLTLDGGLDINARLLDVSEGGLALYAERRIAAGTQLRFRFQLSDGVRVEGKGEITWTNVGGKSGLRFLSVPPVARKGLIDWISQKLEQHDHTPVFINATRPRT